MAYFTISDANIPILKNWGKQLMSIHREEALKTMKYENAVIEGMFLYKGETNYIFAFMCFNGFQKKADPSNPLNQEHRKILQETLISTSGGQGVELNGEPEIVYLLSILLVVD